MRGTTTTTYLCKRRLRRSPAPQHPRTHSTNQQSHTYTNNTPYHTASELFCTRDARGDADLHARREGRPISDRQGHIFQNSEFNHIFTRLQLPKVRPLLLHKIPENRTSCTRGCKRSRRSGAIGVQKTHNVQNSQILRFGEVRGHTCILH